MALMLGVIVAGCSSEMPDGISSRGGMNIFSYPDTVEVFVFGMVSEEGNVSFQRISPVERKWLSNHDYVHVRTEFDSLGTETIRSVEEDANASFTEGETIAGDRVYVRVE